jgi:hypothetical protein
MKLTMKKAKSISVGAVACGILLCSPSAWANWVMGGTQFAGTHFTEVDVYFQVPSAPPSGTNASADGTAISPGVESQNWVLQPVLEYNRTDSENFYAGWTMHNEIVGPNGAFDADLPASVSDGDSIEGVVFLDSSNPGCDVSVGTGCNYVVAWYDMSTGAQGSRSTTVVFPSGIPEQMTWAQGLIFETPAQLNSCADVPGGASTGTVFLYEWSSSNNYTQLTTAMTADNPGTNSDFTDTFFVNGGSVATTCHASATVGPSGDSNGDEDVTLQF